MIVPDSTPNPPTSPQHRYNHTVYTRAVRQTFCDGTIPRWWTPATGLYQAWETWPVQLKKTVSFRLICLGRGGGWWGEIYINVFNWFSHAISWDMLGQISLRLFQPWSRALWLLFPGLALLSSFPYSTNFFSLMFSHRKCWLVLFFLPFLLIVVKYTTIIQYTVQNR